MNPLPSLRPKLREGLPFVYLNAAITADGKLAPANRQFVPFSSKRDQDLLIELRTRCDAVMAGARTVDSCSINLGPGGKKYRDLRERNGLAPYNLRVVVSGSGTLNPNAEVFRHKFSPVVVLVSGRASKGRVSRLKNLGAFVKVCGAGEIDFRYALRWLRKEWNVQRLLCEGGGEINSALLRQDLVDQIYLTLCPIILGGRQAPTLADGMGVERLDHATRLKLKFANRAGNELFLVYSVVRGINGAAVLSTQMPESARRPAPFRAT